MNYKYNEAFCISFGLKLRSIRESKGFSMREFALQADMEYSQLSKIERGVINTTISTVKVLADTLEVPVMELFNFK